MVVDRPLMCRLSKVDLRGGGISPGVITVTKLIRYVIGNAQHIPKFDQVSKKVGEIARNN
jgi:hypothetical protein